MNKTIGACRRLIALAALGIVSLPLGAVSAEKTLDSWVAKSSTLVDKYMSYPSMAIRQDHTGMSYVRVTIDENGHILKYNIIGKSGSNFLDMASLRTVKKIKKFPEIPGSHLGDEMTFGVKLTYDIAYTAVDYRNKLRKTKIKVSSLRTASKGPMSSEIVIFASNK